MKISFQRRTLGSEIQAERLIEAIMEVIPAELREKFRDEVKGNLVWLVTHTQPGSVALTEIEAEIEEYQTFKAYTDNLSLSNAKAIWDGYAALDVTEIIPLWVQAYRDAHQPLIPKAQLDGRLLTDEEKARLQNPDDPLPVTA